MHEVHHQEQQPIVLPRVMDPDHIWVVQRRGDPHLAPEPLPELIVVGQLRREHLQSVDPVERDVGRAVHNPHPAAADQLIDAVTANHKTALELTTSECHRVSPSTDDFQAAGSAPGVSQSLRITAEGGLSSWCEGTNRHLCPMSHYARCVTPDRRPPAPAPAATESLPPPARRPLRPAGAGSWGYRRSGFQSTECTRWGEVKPLRLRLEGGPNRHSATCSV